MKNKDKWVEDMLAETSMEIIDNGFSGQVMAKIRAREKQRFLVLAPFFVAGIASLLVFFPYGALENLAMPLNFDPATQLPILISFLFFLGIAVVVTFSEEAR